MTDSHTRLTDTHNTKPGIDIGIRINIDKETLNVNIVELSFDHVKKIQNIVREKERETRTE